MRLLSGIVVAGALLVAPVFTQSAFAQAAAPQKFTMEGDVALWSVSIRPDKTSDYEQILGRVKTELAKSTAPEAKAQLDGWKVFKGTKPMPDGNVIYTHVITPAPGQDYNLLQVLYQTITDPTEQKTLYDLYRGAFVANLGLSSGTLAVDLSK